jgi:hypothetical protein
MLALMLSNSFGTLYIVHNGYTNVHKNKVERLAGLACWLGTSPATLARSLTARKYACLSSLELPAA